MIHYKEEIAGKMASCTEGVSMTDVLPLVEYPKNPDMGDYAVPCFRLAKALRKSPQVIAAELAECLKDDAMFSSVAAVSGFLNFKIAPAHYAKNIVEGIIESGDAYACSEMGAGRRVIVEYSSVNIAKPFHIGHLRSTMIGESLNRIYKKMGYDVVAINHLGDYGTQFGKLIVAYKLWGDRSILEGDPITELNKLYVRFHSEAESHPAYEDEAREWFTKLENGDSEAVELWTLFKDMSMKEYNRVYGKLGVTFDSYAGESFYSDKMPAVTAELKAKGLLQKSEGAEIVDLEAQGLPPALITKRDGSSLYMTRDLAAAKYRKDTYDFYKNIYVVGSEQQLHFQQWIAITRLMGYGWADDCIHVPFGMIALEGGALSTRKGNVVFLEDVLDKAVERTRAIIEEKNPKLPDKAHVAEQIGIGAVVFQELYTSRMKDYTFSFDRTLSFEGETGPYVQYTHARACSLLRKAEAAGVHAAEAGDYTELSDEASQNVIRVLSKFGEAVEIAHNNYEPHTVARYIVELAQAFNRFYHDHVILTEDAAARRARVALVRAVKSVLKSALYLVCLEAPEQM